MTRPDARDASGAVERIREALAESWQLWGYEQVNDGRTHRAWPDLDRVAEVAARAGKGDSGQPHGRTTS